MINEVIKTIDSFLVKRDDEGAGLGQRHYAGSSSVIVVIEEDECVLRLPVRAGLKYSERERERER